MNAMFSANQNINAQANYVDCNSSMEELIEEIVQNYTGLKDKKKYFANETTVVHGEFKEEISFTEKESETMNIILFGAPGAGKGTQAEAISEQKLIPTISTGNIIREALRSGSELGQKAKSYIADGRLVPDEIVIGIIKERINQDDCKKGFILDGFPRTIPQAEALDKMGVVIDKVLEIDVSDSVIIERMSGRRVCEKCGSSYHLINKKPQNEGTCDKCQGTLIQREDDHPDTVKNRLKVYHEQTEPLEQYYSKQGKLTIIKGDDKTIGETLEMVLKALEA